LFDNLTEAENVGPRILAEVRVCCEPVSADNREMYRDFAPLGGFGDSSLHVFSGDSDIFL
jgi:hypothetical protein